MRREPAGAGSLRRAQWQTMRKGFPQRIPICKESIRLNRVAHPSYNAVGEALKPSVASIPLFPGFPGFG